MQVKYCFVHCRVETTGKTELKMNIIYVRIIIFKFLYFIVVM
jgi:hypothetical protein